MNRFWIHSCHRDWPWSCVSSCRAIIKLSNLSCMFPTSLFIWSMSYVIFSKVENAYCLKEVQVFLYFNRNIWNKFLFVFNAYMLHFHLPLKWSKGTRQYAPYSAMTVDRLENFETPLILHWIQSYIIYFWSEMKLARWSFIENLPRSFVSCCRAIIVFNFSTIFPTSHLTFLCLFFYITFINLSTPTISLVTIWIFFSFSLVLSSFLSFFHARDKTKNISLFLLRSSKFTFFLIPFKNMPLSTLLILAACRTRVISKLRKGPSSP